MICVICGEKREDKKSIEACLARHIHNSEMRERLLPIPLPKPKPIKIVGENH